MGFSHDFPAEETYRVSLTVADAQGETDTVSREIVAIVRRNHLFLPHPNTVLDGGDQLIVLTSPQLRERLRVHLLDTNPT